MKNTNKLFGRRLTKLFLTPVLSIGLLAGFAVTPARADFDSWYALAGEIAVTSSGNPSDGINLDWSTWIEAKGSTELAFNSTGIPFAIVACSEESMVIADCMAGYYNNELFPANPSVFKGIMRNDNVYTGTSATGLHRSVTVTATGLTTPALQWDSSPNAHGINDILGDGSQSTMLSSLPRDSYKLYVYIGQNFTGNTTLPDGYRYYASAPISVDFRPLSATPTISAQPASASKSVGDALSLSVSAAGAGTLNYQWKKGGSAISGATSATYSIPSIATTDAGSYTVDVTNTDPANSQNLNGFAPVTVTSNAAVVTVDAAATTPPTVDAGDSKTYTSKPITFSVGTSILTSASKKNLKASVTAAGKSAEYTITGSAGQMSGVSTKAVEALAKKRANVLKAYLVQLGVSKSSITIKTKIVKQGMKPKTSVLAL